MKYCFVFTLTLVLYGWGNAKKERPSDDDLIEQVSQGIGSAAFRLGLRAEDRKPNPDWASAVMWYQKGSEMGYHSATNNLGVLYAKGEGVRQDVAKQTVKVFR